MTLTTPEDPAGRPVTVWTLEMTAATDLRPATRRVPDADLREWPAAGSDPSAAEVSQAAQQSRFFYRAVGSAWQWVDRREWSDEQWRAWVDQPTYRMLSCWVDGIAAGYVEVAQQGSNAELAYVGLLPDFIGRGLGGWLLTAAVRTSWQMPDVDRVWVHTCSLDGPTALANYQARGFRVQSIDTEYRRVVAGG